MKIYPPSGTVELYEIPEIYEGCVEKFTLMQEDYIELHFNSVDPIYFPIGSYTTWNDKKYYIIEAQQPSYDESTGGYNYELKFEAYYRAWQMRIYKYSPEVDNGTREAEFSLTANLENQVNTFVRCLNKEGFSYNGNGFVSDVPDEAYYNEVKTMTYSSVNFIEALNQIADEWDAEWWVEGKVIHFGKCQNAGEAIEFKLGENVVSMSGSKSETDYATRVYAFGSDKNLPKNYGKGDAVFTMDDNPQISEGFYYLKTDKPLYSYFFNKSDNVHNYEPEFDILNKGKIEIDNNPSTKATVETKTDIATIDSTSYLLGTGKYLNKTFYIDRYKDNKEFCVLVSYKFALIGSLSTSIKLTVKVLLCGDKSAQSKTYEIGNSSVTISNFIAELYTESKDCVLSKKLNTDLYVSGNLSSQNISAFSFDIAEEQNVNIKILVGIEHVINDEVNNTRGPVGEATFGIALPSKSELAKKITLEMANKELYTNVIVNTESEKGIIGRLINDTALFPTYGGKFIRFENEAIANKVKGQKVTIDNIIKSKLPSWYFESETDIQNSKSIKAIAERRLSLPYPYYVEASNVPFNSIVEKVLVFDDIYPCIKSLITKIEPKPQYVYENDEKTDIKYTEYYIHTDDFTFDEDYKLDTAEKLEIKFQTGALTGLTFEAIFHPKAIFNQEELPQQFFQIVRQQFDGGIYLPSDAMHPELDDEFILIGWDASRIEDLKLIEKAEERLATRTRFEIDKMNIDPTTYECTMFSDYTYGLAKETLVTDDKGVVLTDERGIAIRTDDSASGLDESNKNIFEIGQRVKLVNAAFFENGYRDSRIIGYERKMDIPYDSPVYMVGEKAIYSKFSSLEKSIKQIKNK